MVAQAFSFEELHSSLMINPAQEPVAEWVVAVEAIIAPEVHQLAYGNLRTALTQWDDGAGNIINLAIVYEVPGGSTNQINISFIESTCAFSYLALDSQEERHTSSLDEVLQMTEQAVIAIPGDRRRRLTEEIDRWAEQGMRQADLFQNMTKLLQMEGLCGGAITYQEMKAGIAYILAHHRSSGGTPDGATA